MYGTVIGHSMASPDVALPEWPISVVSGILRGDAQMWVAGGAVRDLILGRQPRDWDFVVSTSGLPIARAVADHMGGAYYPLDYERQTGRAIVADPASGHRLMLDFAALRGNSITEDLQARDFTINAMATSVKGNLIDPTGGFADLKLRLLKMVTPDCFSADSVRLIRAVRLSSQLGLAIADDTRSRIIAEAPSIATSAPERVRAELVGLLALSEAAEGLRLLGDVGIFPHVFPELATPNCMAGYTVDAQSLAAIGALVALETHLAGNDAGGPALESALILTVQGLSERAREGLRSYLNGCVGTEVTRSILIRLAALFVYRTGRLPMDAGPRSQFEHRMAELRFSNSAIEFATALARSQDLLAQLAASGTLHRAGAQDVAARRATYRFFRGAREAGVGAVLLALAREADSTQTSCQSTLQDDYVRAAYTLLESYLCRYSEVIAPIPLLRGQELLALGVPPGPSVGKVTALLAEAQAAGEVAAPAHARALVRQWLKQDDDCGSGATEKIA